MASTAKNIGLGSGYTRLLLIAVIKDITNDIRLILTDVQMARILQKACIRVNQADPLLRLERSLAIRATHMNQRHSLVIGVDDGLDVIR